MPKMKMKRGNAVVKQSVRKSYSKSSIKSMTKVSKSGKRIFMSGRTPVGMG